MTKINVLDCTLRDGGYINDWEFKHSNIKMMLNHLTDADLDVIECGFLSNKQEYEPDRSVFDTIERMKDVLPSDRGNSKYVCMVNFNDYDLQDIPDYDGTSVDGIRVAFHKKDLDQALEFCRGLVVKGYMTHINPMVTINYSDLELLKLAEAVNEINPYALYIADSFGVMKKNDLLRIFYLLDHNVNKDILLGYHGHNNMQLAYSNAQALVSANTNRERIIDSSVFGMGRGAGNLNTELFIQYLNESMYTNYKVYPLLQIIDQVLNKIYAKSYWGYSLPHYLSASYNCHPNYASYLSEKNTLTVKSIQEILGNIPLKKRGNFYKEFIEELYLEYQAHSIDDYQALLTLESELKDKEILVVAPGSSIEEYQEKINEISDKSNSVVISINFIPMNIKTDYIFISNEKRYEKLVENNSYSDGMSKLILTSNIKQKDERIINVDYLNLLNATDDVRDNSTLMLLKLLKRIGLKNVNIAGFDGYKFNQEENYAKPDLVLTTNAETIQQMNQGVSKELLILSQVLKLNFITPTLYKYKNIDEVNEVSLG